MNPELPVAQRGVLDELGGLHAQWVLSSGKRPCPKNAGQALKEPPVPLCNSRSFLAAAVAL